MLREKSRQLVFCAIITLLMVGCKTPAPANRNSGDPRLNPTTTISVAVAKTDQTTITPIVAQSSTPTPVPQTFSTSCTLSSSTDVLLFGEADSVIIGVETESGEFCILAEEAGNLFLGSKPISADNRKLVYERTTERGTDEMIIQDLLTGSQITHSMNGYLGSVFGLPDNQHVLYRDWSTTTSQIHLYNIDTETATLWYEGDALNLHGVSPDGEWLVYSAENAGQHDLYAKQIFGDETLRLTNDPSKPLEAVWSPNGEWIAITTFSTQPEPMTYATIDEVYLLNPFTGEEKNLPLIESAYGLQWSPDGSRLAYYVVPSAVPESMQVCVFDLSTQENHCLPGDGQMPAWDPSGRYLAFRSFDTDKSCFKLNIYDLLRDTYVETPWEQDAFCRSTVPRASLWVHIEP